MTAIPVARYVEVSSAALGGAGGAPSVAPPLPPGLVYLTGEDGAILTGEDGALLVGEALT